jgi:hypothetical protein
MFTGDIIGHNFVLILASCLWLFGMSANEPAISRSANGEELRQGIEGLTFTERPPKLEAAIKQKLRQSSCRIRITTRL